MDTLLELRKYPEWAPIQNLIELGESSDQVSVWFQGRRFTWHPGSDESLPIVMNRGGDRLQTGKVDIFTVNADGTGLERITSGNGNEAYPSWSSGRRDEQPPECDPLWERAKPLWREELCSLP